MGKRVDDVGSGDSAGCRASTTSRIDQRSIRKYKKRKRRGELNDIHRKVLKAKDTLDGRPKVPKVKKENPKIAQRILPRPSGIYRNGAKGREIRKAQKKLSARDLDDARLGSDVFKLVGGEECEPQYVEQKEKSVENVIKAKFDALDDSDDTDVTIKNVPINRDGKVSPVLGKVDGKKKWDSKTLWTPRQILIREEDSELDNSDNAPTNRFEQLCTTNVNENFAKRYRLDDIVPEPLGILKAKLRNIYANTFSNAMLREKIRAGINLDDPEITALQTSSTNDSYCTWRSYRTPDSSKQFVNCARVDSMTSFKKNDRATIDNRQSDSALEPTGNYEGEIIERPSQIKFLDFSRLQHQNTKVSMKKGACKTMIDKRKEVGRGSETISCSDRQESSTGVLYNEDPIKRVVFEREIDRQNTRQITLNRNIPEGKSRTVLFRASETQKTKQPSVQTRNQSLKHVPTILRRRKTVQTLKLNQSSVKTRLRRLKEPRNSLNNEQSQETYLFHQESEQSHSHSVQTPQIINKMFEDAKARKQEHPVISQDSFISAGYESTRSNSLHRDSSSSSYKFLQIRPEKTETITSTGLQHPKNNCTLGTCSHTSDCYPEPIREDSRIPREQVYHSRQLYQRNCDSCNHKCQGSQEFLHCKHLQERKSFQEEVCGEHYVLRPYKDYKEHPHCSSSNSFFRENVRESTQIPDSSILDGVGKLQILNDDWKTARISRNDCNQAPVLIRSQSQPIKYLACEDSSTTRRVPIYPRESSICNQIPEDVNSNRKRNHHSTCPKSSSFVLVPARKTNPNVVYLNLEGSLHYPNFLLDDCPHTSKVIYEDDNSRHHAHRERKTDECKQACCSQKFGQIPR